MLRGLRSVTVLVALLAFALGALAPASAAGTALVPLKILAVNDLHGGIDTGRTVGNRPVGGAAYLAATMRAHAAGAPNVLTVGAGDMVGASPPISALLQDEPTIRVMNALGFVLNTPGNHEFDEGVDELFRLNGGGCHPATGCFEGAGYAMVSANVVVRATGQTLFPPYSVQKVQGIPVAFIGATHAEVPTIVTAGAVEGLDFLDPAAEINRYVQELQRQGIHAFVVLIHEGGFLDRQGNLTGPIVPIVDALDPDVDLVVSSHTHQGYATRYAGKLVTQAYSYGTAFADVDLALDPQTNDVVDAAAQIVTVYDDQIEPDPEVQAIVDEAQAQVAPKVERVVGRTLQTLTRNQSRAGESALGNLIADAFRWKMGTPFGMTNPGGIRADLAAGDATWGQLFTVQPFGNDLVGMTLTGEQLYAVFNQQWSKQSDGSERYRPLQVSGLVVAWDGRRPLGDRVVSISAAGRPIDRAARYSVATNSFLAGGGDGFTAFTQGADRRIDRTDLDALVAYLEQLPQPFGARLEGRITRVD